jgi:predicted TIM-barrel fold metal-dependent hydrolase
MDNLSPTLSTGRPDRDSKTLATLWRPFFEVCIDAFGARRCMFESNFPVDSRNVSYGDQWNAFKRLAQGGSPTERADLFSGTANRTYRLGLSI